MHENLSGIQKEPIAIIGLGCRFPGGSNSPSHFWDLMAAGDDGISPVPAERWNTEKFFDADEHIPSRMYIQSGGFLRDRIDQFDAQFFGLSPREAALLDPQQRMLLEVAWEALEDAGLVVERLAGSSTGVYIGGLALDNMLTQLHPDNLHSVGMHTAVSMMMTMLSNRLSYAFDLRGPSMSIDTACSSSLVAVHQACQAIWSGECNLALVGGVNVMHRPEYLVALCKGGFLARDGRCKSFDERADGYGRGEGAGIAVLKPYAQALRDGDAIYAVIRGTGVNQDGRTDGITVPNPLSQEALVRRVMADAGVTPQAMSYIEAHGTGTAVGDPLEAEALAAAVGQQRQGKAIAVGSVKANIGHLEAAAGIASLIKSALVLSHRQIPPLANLGTPNTKIPFQDWNLRLPVKLEPMTGEPGELFVGINSFGYGGTNAHVVLQDAPTTQHPERPPQADGTVHLLPISARSAGALKALASSYADLLGRTDADAPALQAVCSSASLRRDHHDHRLALVANSAPSMREQLQAFSEGRELIGSVSGNCAQKGKRPVFVFTGMGPQWWAMGRELYQHEPCFRQAVDECDRAFKAISDWRILDELLMPEDQSRMDEPHVSACTNFLLQVGLVTLWRSWGIEPAAVVGHSLGEIGAAWAAGVLDMQGAVNVLYQRSRLLNRISGQGTMAGVGMSAAEAAPYLAGEAGRVSLAAINSPKSVTLTGDTESLKRIAAKLKTDKISFVFMQVQMAYHSAYMEPLKEDMYAALKDITIHQPTCEVYSSVTGTRVQAKDMDIDYWWRNMRESVYFGNAIDAMIDDGHRTFLEVGPQPVLSTPIKQCLAHKGIKGNLIVSLRRNRSERQSLREMVATLYVAGMPLNWSGLNPANGTFVRLPTYPWQRETYWHESEKGRANRIGAPTHPLLGERTNAVQSVWESQLINGLVPHLVDHHVQGLRVLAGASYAEQGLALHSALGKLGPNIVENMQFHNALVIDPRDEPVLHVSYDEHLRQYQVHSRKRDGKEWRLHAQGELSFVNAIQPPPMSLAAIQARCSVTVSGETHYQNMTQRGLEYGPYYRGVQHLWHDHSGDEVLAQIEGVAALSDRPESHRLHPALLDAALQTLLTTLGSKGDNEVYIPVSIRRLVLHASPQGAFWCNASLVRRWEGGAEGDVILFDQTGTVIAEVKGVCAQALTRQALPAKRQLDQWLYEFQWQPADRIAPQAGGRWIVMEDKQGVGVRLARELRQIGASEVLQLPPGLDFNRRMELLTAEAAAGLRGVIYLGALDATNDDFGTPAGTQMIRLVQALHAQATVPELIVVTRDAQRVDEDEIQPNVAQATLIGGVRVANNEYPDFTLKAIDIDGQPSSIAALAREAMGAELEDEVALRGDSRYVHRLRRCHADELDAASGQTAHAQTDGGESAIGEHEVQLALRQIRMDVGTQHVAVGEVIRAGRSTNGLQIGDLVLAYTNTSSARLLTIPAAQAFAVPPGKLNTADLAVFTHAGYALSLAALHRDAKVLIIGAAYGLGQAAIQVARLKGAHVLALVQGAEQADAVKRQPGITVVDALACDAMEALRHHTNGDGISLIFDLMPGELSQKAATLLAPFGQFVCLSGATTVTTSWLQGNRVLRRIDMAQLIAHQPDTMRQLWQEASTGLAEGALSALPRRQINHAQLRELEQTGANATQSGIIDVELDAPTPGKRLFDAEASYLITGGFGGFGLACAQWMVEQGARHIALVGRRGADTLQAQQAVHALQQAGATVMCAAADVSLEADVIKLIDEISQTMPPLRGVFHTAAVLKDSPINQILPEHVHAVMNPKAAGAWYLHQHTQSTSLDYFVLFSSVAGLIGGPGQASYAMSCEYQDALARHRRALGLAATSINWGALAEVGMVARHSEVAKYFSVTGVGSFSPAQAVDLLGKALAWNPVNIGMAIMNWPSWGATYPAWAASPKYAELAGDTGEQDQASDDSALINSLRAMADAERLQSVEDILASHLAKVCQMPLERIDRQASLLNMGLDSLMSMELQMTIETELGVKVSTLELMKGNNLIQLAHVIAGALMDKIPSKQARPTDHPANSAESIPSVSEQVDSLQDDEIDKLLSQLLKQEQVQA